MARTPLARSPVLFDTRLTPTFVSTPLFRRGLHQKAAVCRTTTNTTQLRRRVRIRVSLDSERTESDAEVLSVKQEPTITKTEKIAAMLGQSRTQMEEKAERIKMDARKENIRKYSIAVATTIVSTALFLLQKSDPNAGLNLMKFLVQSSAPVEIVGTNGLPTLIEFSATWCENCKVMAPRVFELEKEFVGRVNFVVVDGDDPSRQEMVDRFGVDGVPQFSMVGKDGSVKGNLVGMVPKAALASDLEALLHDVALPFPGLSLDELRPLSD